MRGGPMSKEANKISGNGVMASWLVVVRKEAK